MGTWGFTSLKKLKYPNECIGVNIGHKIMTIIHFRSVVIGVFRSINLFIIILFTLVDLIEVIRIKIVTLNAEVSFDRFSKELRLISVSLGSFRIETQSRKIVLTLWLQKLFNFTPRLSMASFLANVVTEPFPTSL